MNTNARQPTCWECGATIELRLDEKGIPLGEALCPDCKADMERWRKAARELRSQREAERRKPKP